MPSNIEWTEETLNPVTGCDKISAGCKNCYAEKMAKRLKGMGQKNYANGFKVTLHEHMLDIPMKRKKATKYFVCSMADIAHDDVPFEFMDKVFATAALCLQHEFIFLTKRYQRLCDYLTGDNVHNHTRRDLINAAAREITGVSGEVIGRDRWPLPNVKIIHSVSNQPDLNLSYPILAITPAAYRMYSYEPALGPVDFKRIRYVTGAGALVPGLDYKVDAFDSKGCVDGVICGGESGPGARPMYLRWVQDLRNDCMNAGIPFFFKQWGAYMPCSAVDPGIVWVGRSGKVLKPEDKYDQSEYPLLPMKKVGKKAAGDILDGKQYHEWPV